MGSNRSITPITTFDWLINVALGSTLAGIVNGNSLIRGLLGLATMLGFQYAISLLTSLFYQKLSWIFEGPPLVVVFRGKMLMRVMKKHWILKSDVNASLRHHGVLNVCLVECAIIEPNSAISVFTMRELEEAKVEPEVLMTVPAYKALCERDVEAGYGDRVRRRERGTSRGETTESGNIDDGKPREVSRDSNSIANAASSSISDAGCDGTLYRQR
jgi:uncharacterized membrane protein YcaP (DUF421 family)